MSPTPIKIIKLICFLYNESKLPLHQYLNLDLCRCFVWLDASRTINYCVLRELILNKVGINNKTLYKCMDHLYGTVCSHSITLFSRIPSHQKHKQNNKDSLSPLSYILYIIDSAIYFHCLRYSSLFHGPSSFLAGPNQVANAFIFRLKEEERKQENVYPASSDANPKANTKAEAEDGIIIVIVFMEPDKEPPKLQTNRRSTSA